jgi:spermidine/putrescine transport system substrate-binding protein
LTLNGTSIRTRYRRTLRRPDQTATVLKRQTTPRSSSSSALTQSSARRFSRRTLLKNAAAFGALAATGPVLVRDAKATGGELRFLLWSDYLPTGFLDGFVKQTGITVRHVTYGSNEELMHRLQATKGRGFDLIGPSTRLAEQWRETNLLIPFDASRVPADRIAANFYDNATAHWTWDDELYYLPYVWGTEAVAWRTDAFDSQYAEISYGSLWTPGVKGRVMGRPHSMLLGIGLYLDATGVLPSNRMRDAYENEDEMRRIWSGILEFATRHRDWVKLFWNDAETQINGFQKNDVIIGQTWDGPPLRLKRQGEPIDFRAPVEGALAWIDGLSIPLDARNIDEIYAFLDYLYTPENAALLSQETGYNPVVNGANDLLDAESRQAFFEAYPDNALENLWWWQPEPRWYAQLRQGFTDRYVAGEE